MTWNPFANTKKAKAEKQQQQEAEAKAAAAREAGKKDHATPKRKDAQAMSYTPLIPDPKDRKARRKIERRRTRARENREYAAMESGDVSQMPKAERNPMRIYIRDWIDARWNLGEWFIPAAIVLLIGSMSISSYSTVVGFVLAMIMYVYMFAVIADLFAMWFTLKRSLLKHKKWDGDRSELHRMHILTYALSRSLQIRRMRVPRPREKKRGVWPD